jgi:hypothetical protein
MITEQDQNLPENLRMPSLKEFKIVILGDDSRDEQQLKDYLDIFANRLKSQFKLQIQKFDIDFSIENDKGRTKDDFIDELVNLVRILQKGVHLIMICFSVSKPRANITYAAQVYRFLGMECYNNLFSIITGYDKLNEKYKELMTSNIINGLSSVMMKNVMLMRKQNIIPFDPQNSAHFDKQIIENLNIQKNSEFKIYHDVNLCSDSIHSKLSSIYQIADKYENLQRFLESLPEIKEYIQNFKKENYFKYYANLLLDVIFRKRSKIFKFSFLCVGICFMIMKFQSKNLYFNKK